MECSNKFVLNLGVDKEKIIENVKETYSFIESLNEENICLVIGYE